MRVSDLLFHNEWVSVYGANRALLSGLDTVWLMRAAAALGGDKVGKDGEATAKVLMNERERLSTRSVEASPTPGAATTETHRCAAGSRSRLVDGREAEATVLNRSVSAPRARGYVRAQVPTRLAVPHRPIGGLRLSRQTDGCWGREPQDCPAGQGQHNAGCTVSRSDDYDAEDAGAISAGSMAGPRR